MCSPKYSATPSSSASCLTYLRSVPLARYSATPRRCSASSSAWLPGTVHSSGVAAPEARSARRLSMRAIEVEQHGPEPAPRQRRVDDFDLVPYQHQTPPSASILVLHPVQSAPPACRTGRSGENG